MGILRSTSISKSGRLSWQLRPRRKRRSKRPKKAANKMREIFKKIDTDGNYLIERAEFVKAMGAEAGCAADVAEKMFVAIDLTKSGSLSMAEFKGFLTKMEDDEEDKDGYIAMLTK